MNEDSTQNEQPPYSRRDFIRTSSLAAGAVASLGVPASVFAQGDSTLKVALIGCGGRGTGATAEALNNTACPARLVAMADAFQHRLDLSLIHI